MQITHTHIQTHRATKKSGSKLNLHLSCFIAIFIVAIAIIFIIIIINIGNGHRVRRRLCRLSSLLLSFFKCLCGPNTTRFFCWFFLFYFGKMCLSHVSLVFYFAEKYKKKQPTTTYYSSSSSSSSGKKKEKEIILP